MGILSPIEAGRLWAEPPVQGWPFAARVLVHTGIWTLWLLVLQYVLLAAITVLHRSHLRQLARSPQRHWAQMLLHTTIGYASWVWPIGILAAWLNPGAGTGGWQWDFSCPNLLLLGYYAMATLMAYDAYSFFLHRWLHVNKTAFRLLHAKHHESRAALDVTTSGYMSPLEGAVSAALPMLLLFAAGMSTGNWWYTVAGLWNSMHIVITGHCGHELTLSDVRDIPVLLLNPFGLWFFGCPCHATPMEHEDHHTFPTRNFSFFYTFWDDLYKTSRKDWPRCTLLVLVAHAVFQAAFLGTVYFLGVYPNKSLAAYILLYVFISPAAAAAAAQRLQLPETCRRLFGGLMDAYRRDNHISYPEAGRPGSFHPEAAASAARAAAITAARRVKAATADATVAQKDLDAAVRQRTVQQKQAQRAPVFLFACHPTGLLSRAAFCTFGARGWHSPVSSLRKVRLAVGSLLLQVPVAFVREFLLCCGCIPADRTSMKQALQSGTSVAICPGGWRESRHLQTYNLVLHKRKGFVALAAETGALLVPVLCLGEQDLVGDPSPGFRVVKWLQSKRPKPVHVVFGQPLMPQADETVEQLHSRYEAALLDLGKQHGVKLTIVE